MSRIFLSHHNSNNQEALALKLWLESQGWREEIFLDFDPIVGIKTGTRWKEALSQAGTRCEAILCLTSPGWVGSPDCLAEYRTAENLSKKIFIAQIADLSSPDKTREWQGLRLFGEGPFTEIPLGPAEKPVKFVTEGLTRLKLGLLEAGISGVLPKHFPWPPADDPKRKPYRGLRPLEFKDAGIYFGRNAEILNGLAKLHRMRRAGDVPLFIILGASGTGKSSFLRAGLLPRLKNEDRDFYPLNVVRPQKQPLFGDSGLAHVIAVANAELKLNPVDEGDVEAQLKKGPQACSELLHRIQQAAQTRLGKLADPALPPSMILPVDQAEELFNADTTSEARMFLDMIGAVVRGEANGKRLQRVSLLVAFTIRSDRYEPLQTAPELKGIERELFDELRPMPPAQFREVIIGPASRASVDGHPLEVEEQLIARLVDECTKGADTLPLLGLILDKLYRKYGGDGKLELREYLQMGELGDIIRTEAESVLSSDQGKREVELAHLHAAFIPYLVTVDRENNQPIRRVARMANLPQGSRPLIQVLIEKRLLLSDWRNNEQVVEVAHESLFRQWKVLKEWIREEEEDLKEAARLEEETKVWLEKKRKDEYLRRGERLIRGEGLANRQAYREQLKSVQEFLKASRDSEDWRQQDKLRIEREKQEGTEKLEKQFREATALRLVAQAQNTLIGKRSGGTELGLLTLLAASRISSMPETEGGLLDGIVAFQRLEKIFKTGSIIRALAISPDGYRLLYGSDDKTLQLCDVQTGKPIGVPLVGHEWGVYSVAFSPDGERIVSGSGDKNIRLWDAGTGEGIGGPLTGHSEGVLSVAYSSDGTRIASGSEDRSIRLWDAYSGKSLAILTGHEGPVNSVVFNPDGTRIVSGGMDGTIRLWDVHTGQPLGAALQIQGRTSSIGSVAFSHDGRRILSGGAELWLWDARTGQVLRGPLSGHKGFVSEVTFSPDGTRMISSGDDGSIRWWDGEDGRPIGHIETGHISVVTALAISPDGRRFFSSGPEGTLRIWNAAIMQPVGTPLSYHNEAVTSVAFSPDGKRILSGSTDQTVQIAEVHSWPSTSISLTGHNDDVNSVAFSPDGNSLVSASADKTIMLWNAHTRKPIGKPIEGHEGSVASVTFDADGTRLISAGEDGTLRRWEVGTGQMIGHPLEGHQGWVRSVVIGSDGTCVISGGDDGTLRFWDFQTGKAIGELTTGGTGGVSCLAVSPDGTRLLVGNHDGRVSLWDIKSRQTIGAPLIGHAFGAYGLAVSPNGTHVVSGGGDKSIRVWDLPSGHPIGPPLEDHQNTVTSVAFSPDGMSFISGGGDGTVRLWPAPKVWPDLLCAKLTRNMSRKEWSEHVSPDIEYIEQCPGLPIPPDESD